MKNIKTRYLLLTILTIAAILFTLTACGPKKDDNSTNDPNSGQSNQGTQDQNPTDESEKSNPPSQEQLTDLFRKGQELTGYSYDLNFTSSYGTTVSKIWIKGSDMKIQTENEGKMFTMIYSSNVSYTLDHESKTALKYTWEDSEVDEAGNYTDIQNVLGDIQADAFQFIGEETINDEECYVVETKDLQSDTLIKIWLHKDYGLSMRVEMTGNTPEEDVLTEISNLEVGNLSSDTFQVPNDYQILDWDSSTDFPVDDMENPDENQE